MHLAAAAQEPGDLEDHRNGAHRVHPKEEGPGGVAEIWEKDGKDTLGLWNPLDCWFFVGMVDVQKLCVLHH